MGQKKLQIPDFSAIYGSASECRFCQKPATTAASIPEAAYNPPQKVVERLQIFICDEHKKSVRIRENISDGDYPLSSFEWMVL